MNKKSFLCFLSYLMKKKQYHNIKPITLFIIITLFNISCTHKNLVLNENTITISKFPIEENISFSDIHEFKDGVAGMLKLVDSTLIIFNVDGGGKYFLYNYDLKSANISKGYLRKGKGPGEAIGAREIGVNGNTIWLYDISLKKIVTLDRTSALINNVKDIKEYSVGGYYYMIDFKDSLNYFCVGSIESEFRIQEVDLFSSMVTKEYGIFKNIPENIPLVSFKSAYQSFIYTKPTGDKIVLPYRFLDAIEIYDLKTKTNILIHGPEGFDVKYKPLENGMNRTNETRHAFVNGTVTEKFIYMSYSGLLCSNKNSIYGNSIYIYDWNGNPIRKLVLNRYIEGLVVSEDDKIMYAYDVNSGFLVKSIIN